MWNWISWSLLWLCPIMESWSPSSLLLSCATLLVPLSNLLCISLGMLALTLTLSIISCLPLSFVVYKAAADDANVRESWILPVVLKFDGKPVVTENGNIVYQFEVSTHCTYFPRSLMPERLSGTWRLGRSFWRRPEIKVRGIRLNSGKEMSWRARLTSAKPRSPSCI